MSDSASPDAQDTTPVSPQSDSSPMAAASNASAPPRKASTLADTMKGAFASLDPFAKTVSKEFNKGFHQVVQFAGEKLGTAEVTPLPQEYLDLEAHVDRLKTLNENLAKIAALQIQPGTSTDIKFAVYGAVSHVADTLGTTQEQQLNSVNEKLRTVTVNNSSPNQIMADEFANAGNAMGEDSPVGSALLKVADAQRKIGKARVHMNSEINEKFVKRLTRSLETTFRNVNQYRRSVHSSRVKLDALKARARSATPEKAEEFSEELQVSQAEFNSLVTMTIDLMKAAIASTEPLAALADMMATMLAYFQTGFELLSEVAPEIDAIKVSQEALAEKTSTSGGDMV